MDTAQVPLIERIESPESDHSSIRVLPCHSERVASIWPLPMMLTLHVAVVPLKLRLGRAETVRGSAAYAVIQLNRKRSRTVSVASFFIGNTLFVMADGKRARKNFPLAPFIHNNDARGQNGT